jgi:tripartite-type tricarboxylate transporter receptor subunit TctC
MADPKLRERLAKLDVAPEYAPGSALQAKLQSEIRNWSAFVDERKIKAE